MIQRLYFILALLSIGFATQAKQVIGEPLDHVIALVGEDVVLASEIDRRVESLQYQYQRQGKRLEVTEALKEDILKQLIDENLQLQVAQRSGIRVNDQQLQRALERVAYEDGLTIEELVNRMRSQGHNFALFREDLRSEIMIGQIRRNAVRSRIFVSEQEINNMVERLKQEEKKNLHYWLGHIVLKKPEGLDEDKQKEFNQLLDDMAQSLRQGTDFSSLAREFSQAPDRANGGDLGWRRTDELPSLYAQHIRDTMVKGDIVGPLESPLGFHIVKIYGIEGRQTSTQDQVRARHILVKPSTILSDDHALLKISGIYEEIMADPSKFAELAREHSEDYGSANQGGDLGWAPPQVYDPAFAETLANLKKGEISGPFKSSFGWHIAKLEGRRVYDNTEEQRRAQAINIIRNRKYEHEATLWVNELRDEAFIKILDEKYADVL